MKNATLFSDIGEVMTLEEAHAKKGRGPMVEGDLSVRTKQVMIVADGVVQFIGPRGKIPRHLKGLQKEVSVKGANLFPGFIDCHTHSVFMGDRSSEFELRNQGATYQDIAKRGGGILSTVRETRKGKLKDLQKKLEERLLVFLKQGVTTVEVKSGYGLTIADEIKMLKAVQANTTPVQTVSTFLGAHALPPEFTSRALYLEELKKALPRIYREGLATRLDIFIEQNYFSIEESRAYIKEAQALGFQITIHADQLSRTGASAFASEIGALSADHAICVNENDMKQLAQSETTCVLLPASDFYIHCPYPPARQMIDRGVRVALSTDFNPGTSPTQNIQLVGLLARLNMKMTLPEVFVALTVGGAHALGFENERGALVKGFAADFFVSERSWREYFYDLNPVSVQNVWVRGRNCL